MKKSGGLKVKTICLGKDMVFRAVESGVLTSPRISVLSWFGHSFLLNFVRDLQVRASFCCSHFFPLYFEWQRASVPSLCGFFNFLS